MSRGERSRRHVVRGMAAAGLAAAGGWRSAATEATTSTVDPHAWRIPYGCAVRPELLASDTAYRAAILRTCRIVVPEGALKWPVIRPTRKGYHFEEGDAYVAFAQAHGLTARGHTLVWGEAMPAWTKDIRGDEAEALLTTYIQTVVDRYAGRIASWDVVNEPMDPGATTAGALRASVWLRTLGPRHIDLAFRAAAAADPRATLVLNEYDLEYAVEPYRTKREGFLALIRGLVDRKVPLHAVGLQGHLRGDRVIDREGLSAFAGAVKTLGLRLIVTELDVIDSALPGPDRVHDALVADQADAFLGALFAAAPPAAVLTWGLTDRYTWMPMYYKRPDGSPNRPLPLDADYRRKPLMDVIERYCR